MRLVVADGKVQRIKRKSLAGQGVLLLLALQILFLSSFVGLSLPTATGHNLLNVCRLRAQAVAHLLPAAWQSKLYKSFPELTPPVKQIRTDMYTPQAPVALFLGYAFGNPVAPIAAALFLAIGTIGPAFGIYLFASGGGLDYYSQPGFGYLIGMIAATYVVGRITGESRTSMRQIAALACGTFVLHFVGILYVLGASLIFAFVDGGRSGPEWLPWVFEQIRNLSWYPLPYDAIFGMALIGLGFPVRRIVSVLTAPDISLRSKADIVAQQRIEELLH